MKKKLLVVGGVTFLILVGVAAGLWVAMMGGVYEPGMVRAQDGLDAPLAPPSDALQPDGSWKVTDNVRLFNFAHGEGGPVLVVHGGPGFPTQAPWKGLDLLADDHRFVYYHQRGCGRSTRPFQRFESNDFMANRTQLIKRLGLAAHIADIERIRHILGQDQLTLVGHSFGGFIAALYAAEFPDRVRGLVLVAPANLVVFPSDEDDLFTLVRARLPAEQKTEYDAYVDQLLDYGGLFTHSEQDLATLNAKFADYYAVATQDHEPAAEPATLDPKEVGGFVQPGVFMSMGFSHDYAASLVPVQAPVLILHGEHDLQSEQSSRTYESYFPNTQFRVIPSAGHFMCDQQPRACAEAIGAFLGTLG